MKKNHFWQSALFASALLFGFTACSSDDNGAPQQNTNQERTLTIALNTGESTPSASRRATTISNNPTDNGIENAIIAIFNESGDVVKSEKVAKGNTDVVPGTSTQKWPSGGNVITLAAQGLKAGYEVWVVANPGSTASTNLLAAATKNDFKAVTTSAQETLVGATSGAEKENNFVMIGKGTLQALGTGGIDFNTSEIKMYRMAAKIGLESITCDLNSTIYENTSVTIKDVYLDNVPALQKFDFIDNTTSIYTSVLNGINVGSWNTATGAPAAGTDYLSTGELTIAAYDGSTKTAASLSDKYYFYTLPNSATSDKLTRLVVTADFGGTIVYYPIYLNWNTSDGKTWSAVDTGTSGTGITRAGKGVYANDFYKITLVINSVGVTDPTQDLDPQAVQVTIGVENWAEFAQTAKFTN